MVSTLASIDVSDGLIADLRHVCASSGLGAVIAGPSVPLSDAARRAIETDPRYLVTALTGGDDYEIAFTAPASAVAAIEELSQTSGIPITAIGYMTAGEGHCDVTVLDESERPLPLASQGWTHFGS